MSSHLIPLLPNQAWFLAELEPTMLAPSRWNLAQFLDLPGDVTDAQVRRAVESVWRAHESLRARVVRTASGWCQELRGSDEPLPFRVLDVEQVPRERRGPLMARIGADIRMSVLDIPSGRLVDVTLFRCGPDEPPRLLLVVHHLLADVLSLRLVVADIETALVAVARGEEPPPPRGDTLEACVEGFHTYVEHHADDDLETWARGVRPAAVLPTASCSLHAVHTWSFQQHDVSLGGLTDVGRASGTGRPGDPELALLAGVGAAVAEAAGGWVWCKTMTHGRALRAPDGRSLLPVGARRTVGFFASSGLTQIGPRDGRAPDAHATDLAEHLEQLPNRGLAPTVVRWLRPDGQRPAVVDEAWSASTVLFHGPCARQPAVRRAAGGGRRAHRGAGGAEHLVQRRGGADRGHPPGRRAHVPGVGAGRSRHRSLRGAEPPGGCAGVGVTEVGRTDPRVSCPVGRYG